MPQRASIGALSWLAALLVLPLSCGALPVRAAAAADEGDAALAAIRRGFPAEQTIYRATWLPDRFDSPQFNTNPYGIIYQGDEGERLTFAFEINATGEPLRSCH